MKTSFKFIIIPFLLLAISTLSFAKKTAAKTYSTWETKLEKLESSLNQGFYKDVVSQAESFVKDISKSEFYHAGFAARASALQLRANLAMNNFESNPKLLDTTVAVISRIAKDSLKAKYLANTALTDYYLEAGYHFKAEMLMNEQISMLKNSPLAYFTNYSKLQLAKAYLGEGRNNEALKILDELDPIFLGLVTSKNIGDDGNPVKKISSFAKTNRKIRYGQLLNLKALVYLQQGDYKLAKQILGNSVSWIKSNIGTKSEPYKTYCRLNAEVYIALDDHKSAAKYYLKGFKSGGLRKAAQQKLELNELLVGEYVLLNKPSKLKKYNRNLQLASKRAYGKENFYYHGKDFVEVKIQTQKGHNEKAKRKLDEILIDFPNMPEYHPKNLQYLAIQFELAKRLGDLALAEKSLNEMLKINKLMLGENSPEYHKTKLLQAQYMVQYGSDFKGIEDIFNESFTKNVQPQILKTNNNYTDYLNSWAEMYEVTDRYEKAFKLRTTALQASEERYGNFDMHYAYEAEQLAQLLLKKGEYAKADTLLKKALKIAKAQSNQNDSKVIATYQGVAKLYSTLGYYDEAKDILDKALYASQKNAKKQGLDVAETADELAELYLKTGSYNDAEDLLKEAILLKEQKAGANNRELINSLNLLGKVYLETGNYSESEKNIRRAQKISSKIFSDTSLIATESLLLLEELYVAIGDFSKAEANLKLALKNQERILGRKHLMVANTLTRLALIKLKQPKNKTSEIETLLNEATATIKEKLGDKNPIYADQLKDLAHFYFETKQYDKADTLLGIANAYWVDKLSKNNVHSAEIAMIRGDISTNKATYDKAGLEYEKARNIYEKIFSDTHPDYVNATSKQARIFYIKNQNKKSLDLLEETTRLYLDFTKKYFPSLSFREKNKYWNLIKDDFEFYNSLVFKMKDEKPALLGDVYNNTIATKALLLSSSIKVKERILSSNDTLLVSKFKKYVALKEYVTSVISMSPQQLKDLNIDPKSMEKEIESLEKELSERSEDFASDGRKQNITWKDIKNTLKPNEYAVELVRYRYFDKQFTDSVVYAAMIISADTKSQPDVVVIPNGKALENKYIKYFRNSVKFKNDDQYSYNMFWKAIKAKLPDGATVYMSSEGVYNQLNVEMLQSPDGKYVLDQNNFVLISNTKDLVIRDLELKAKPKKGVVKSLDVSDVVLMGNPELYLSSTGSHDVSQLDGAEKEVKVLYDFLSSKGEKVQKFIGKQVTEEGIKNLKNPRIFHIATHAYFKEDVASNENSEESEFVSNPLLNSGMLLSGSGDILDNKEELNVNAKNGVLTALEASNLYFDNTELVVLSACETGLGQVQVGEGVYGLQRSFLVAGANSIVMSLFKVNDEVTQKLMVLFYEKWKATGDRRKAFNDAKKEIKDLYKFPIYWGSFVMIGA